MAVSLPRIAQLLAKVGVGAQAAEAAGDKSPLSADKSGLQKGQVLDADGKLVAGLGYNPADRTKAGHNLHEKSSVDAFVKALKGEVPGQTPETPGTPAEAKGKDADVDKPKAKAEEGPRAPGEEDPGRREGRELREDRQQDLRREERQEEARALGQKEAKEQGETREAKEPVERRVERDRPDDEDKHGHAYVFVDPEEDQDESEGGYRSSEVFADAERCHGVMEDGTRCVRRSREGRPFCRVHMHGASG